MPSLRMATLDVFTDLPLLGNQLGLVHVPAGGLGQDTKQQIAREFGYSETVFLHDEEESGGGVGVKAKGRRVDIFTPFQELPFAGHPTIGTLCYIAQEASAASTTSSSSSSRILLQLKSGLVEGAFDTTTRHATALIPHDVHIHKTGMQHNILLPTQPELSKRLGNDGEDLNLCTVSIVKGMTFVLTELPNVDMLGQVRIPDLSTMPTVQVRDEGWDVGILGYMFYTVLDSFGTPNKEEEEIFHLRARMVEARFGEDPATGSACCALACALALKRGGEGKVRRFEIRQGVEMGRASRILVEVGLDGTGRGVEWVKLKGQAVVVVRGTMEV